MKNGGDILQLSQHSWVNSGACSTVSQGLPKGMEPQMTTVVSHPLRHLFLTFLHFQSHFPSPSLVLHLVIIFQSHSLHLKKIGLTHKLLGQRCQELWQDYIQFLEMAASVILMEVPALSKGASWA
jgi:hypothetical protein